MNRLEQSNPEEAELHELLACARAQAEHALTAVFRTTTNENPGQLLLPLPSINRSLHEVMAERFPSREHDYDWYEVEAEYEHRRPPPPRTNDALGDVIFDGDLRKRLCLQDLIQTVYAQYEIGIVAGDGGLTAQVYAIAVAREILNRIPDHDGNISRLEEMLYVAQQTLDDQLNHKRESENAERETNEPRKAGRPKGRRKSRLKLEFELRCIRAVTALLAGKRYTERAAFEKVWKIAKDADSALFVSRNRYHFSKGTVGNWWREARALANKTGAESEPLNPRVIAFTFSDWPFSSPAHLAEPLLESLKLDKLALPIDLSPAVIFHRSPEDARILDRTIACNLGPARAGRRHQQRP